MTEAWTEPLARAKIAEILQTNFKVPEAKITDDASFKRTLGMDSLDIVDFIFFLQKAFGFKADIADYREVHTVALLTKFVVARAPKQ